MPHIFPSLIAADQLNLKTEITALNPYCYGFHLDVMDNHFVPNLTWGPLTVNAISNATKKIIWVHLMVKNPDTIIEMLDLPEKSIITFHFESTDHHETTIKYIKEKKWQAGIAISPKTDPREIFHLLHVADQVLLMSVNPGFAGQPFLPTTVAKIDPILAYRATHNLNFFLAMDGGITDQNISELAKRGVDQFVVGSSIFNTENPIIALQKLQQLIGEKL